MGKPVVWGIKVRHYCHPISPSHSSPKKGSEYSGYELSSGYASAGLISMEPWLVLSPLVCSPSRQRCQISSGLCCRHCPQYSACAAAWKFGRTSAALKMYWTWNVLFPNECFRQLSFSFTGFWSFIPLCLAFCPTTYPSVSFCCQDITNSRQFNLRITFFSFLVRIFLPCLRYYLHFSRIMLIWAPVWVAHMKLSGGFCYRQQGNLKNL